MGRISLERSIGQMFGAGMVHIHVSGVEKIHQLQKIVNTRSKCDVESESYKAKGKDVLRSIMASELLGIFVFWRTPFYRVRSRSNSSARYTCGSRVTQRSSHKDCGQNSKIENSTRISKTQYQNDK